MIKKAVFVLQTNSSNTTDLLRNLSMDYDLSVDGSSSNALETLTNKNNYCCIVVNADYDPAVIIDFVSKLSSNPVSKKIPVIAILSSNNEKIQKELIEAGAQDFVAADLSYPLVKLKIDNLIKYKETSSFILELELDELTGLYNRKVFLRKAREIVDANPNKQYVILAVDFEKFKVTNSQYGEERCNQFLSFIGAELKKYTENGIAGRYGGDLFVALFEYSDKIDFYYLNSVVEKGLKSSPIPHQIAKIGVYAPIDKNIPLILCCDRAFLAIKEIKGIYNNNIAFHEPSMQQQLLEEQKILDSMETALQEEQFLVYYQPKHETVTGKIAGCEALVRWIHPEYGFMSPGKFIPLFEKNGFVTKIDGFVVKKVCADIIRWQKKGMSVPPVSINISRRDYLEKGWIKKQVEYIDSLGIDHSLIHFEVTESMYAESMELIIEQVRDVQSQRFLIEMDDFGAGYSALGLLATFPLDVIKLDISFVRHLETNEIVIENIIKMAHRMGFSVVAEGAETKEQFKVLKTLGCDLIQGYCFSPPLPSEDFEKYIVENGLSDKSHKNTINQITSKKDGDYFNEYMLKAASEVAESIPGGYFCYHADGDHEIISFNNEILKIFECDNAKEFREYTGNSFNGMVGVDHYEQIQSEIDNAITKENDIYHIKFTIKTKKGNIKYIDDYSRLVYTSKYGNIFYVFMNDITKIHEQHIEVQKRTEVIQGLSRSFKSICLIDFETRQLIPYSVKDQYKEIMDALGADLDYDSALIKFVDNYVLEEEREKIKSIATIENIQKQFEVDDFFSFTFHLIKDGEITLNELAIRKISDDDVDSRAVLTFRTVSTEMIDSEIERNKLLVDQIKEHKAKERLAAIKLKCAYDEAAASSKASSILMSRFADDVTEILNKMTEYSEKMIISDDLPSLREYVEEITNYQEKVHRRVNNIKISADIISGVYNKVDIKPTDCTLGMERMRLMVEEAASKKGIKVEVFSNISNPYIYQDLDKTSQVSLSIVDNAIKYTPKGGTIRFGITQIPGGNQDECYMKFECFDNGIGISEEFLPHVFEPFSREDNDINKVLKSPGLGLYTSKALLDLVNGSINVESKPGKGTVVTVIQKHSFADPAIVKKV